MKEAIQKIRKLLKANAYTDEQHVRFSLVGLICQKLGWDVWDPREFHTEYRVEKLHTQDFPDGSDGKVDVALFLADRSTNVAQVFMEIKAPGKLMSDLKRCEDQLTIYSGFHRIAIGVLTDGVIWRFYTPPMGGYFYDTLFAELDIVNDDIDELVSFFNEILHRDNYRDQVIRRAKELFDEIGTIKQIQDIKEEAIMIAKTLGRTETTIARDILSNKMGTNIDEKEIERLWNKKVPFKVDRYPARTTYAKPMSTANINVAISSDPWIDVSYKRRTLKATGRYNIETSEFVLCKGSEIKRDHSKNLTKGYTKRKMEMIQNGVLQLDSTGSKYILKEDTRFSAPSPPAAIVAGRPTNGHTSWIDEMGREIDVYRKKRVT